MIAITTVDSATKSHDASPKKSDASLSDATAEKAPNPALILGFLKREFYTAGTVLVYGGYNHYIDQIDGETIPKKWRYLDNSEAIRTKAGYFYTSLKLRYAHKALLTLQSMNSDYIISAATVNFSRTVSDTLSKAPKGAASIYGDKLKKRLDRINRSRSIHFLAVLEEKANKLHAHLLVLHHPTDTSEIRARLKMDTDHGNATLIKTQFKRYSRAKPGSAEAELEELAREADLSNFPYKDARGYYQICEIDAGWLDYLSKAMHHKSRLMADHRHFYIPRDVRKLTHTLYENARIEYIAGIEACRPLMLQT